MPPFRLISLKRKLHLSVHTFKFIVYSISFLNEPKFRDEKSFKPPDTLRQQDAKHFKDTVYHVY